MPEQEPITRVERFLNGEVGMTPITREEKILAGEDIETVTRREYFLKKYRGGGGGDITVESLSVTSNGTYTAPSGKAYSPVEVDVPLPENAYLLKSVNTPTPIASFSDGEEMVMPSLKVAIEPQQDLHGYDHPWVGGAGKNKLNAVDGEKTSQGITFVSEDGVITANGTSTGNAYISICGEDGIDLEANTSYVLSGCPTGGSSTTYQIDLRLSSTFGSTYKAVIDRGSGFTFTTDEAVKVYPTAIVRNEYVASNLVFKPMIRLASVTDATFEPYSNICPIIGWSETNVTVADDVETPTVSNVYTIDLDGTRYGGTLDVISGVLTITDGYIASYNSEALPSTWISDRDVYAEGTTPTIGAEVVYKLATPQTYQLSPTQVKSLLGQNNVWADTGDIKDAEYFSKEV